MTDRSLGDEWSLIDRVDQAVTGGVDLVQLREKDLPGGELLKMAWSLKEAIAGRAMFMINERVDVAIAVGADGVQLGEYALPVGEVRKQTGPHTLIGRSVHSVHGADQARDAGADFLLVGTMFQTRSHPGAVAAGPGLLAQIAESPGQRSKPLPLIGIGGINAANLGEVVLAGASGVAVITSILGSPHPKAEATKLKKTMSDAWRNASAMVSAETREVSP